MSRFAREVLESLRTIREDAARYVGEYGPDIVAVAIAAVFGVSILGLLISLLRSCAGVAS